MAMEPQDEHSMEPSFAEQEPEVAPMASEAVRIDPEVGAALLLSGNYSRSLCDRVFSALTQDEVMRVSQGIIRLRSTPEDRLERMWNRLTLLFTGDWREEDDLVEFIRTILRKGVRDEPSLTPLQKLAILLLSLPEEVGPSITSSIQSTLNRSAVADLTRELAHLLHYPNADLHDRVVGEFLAFCRKRNQPQVRFLNLSMMELEAERYVYRDPHAVADVMQRLWLGENEPLATFHLAAREQPGLTTRALKLFAYGPAQYTYIPPLDKAATFRACLSPQAAMVLDEAMEWDDDALPEPFVSTTRKEIVLREFLHRFYLEYMKNIPLILQ